MKVLFTFFFDCNCVAQNCGKTNHGLWFLVKNKTVIMPQPQYSPDLASADFFLFPKLKTPLKGKHFATIEEIKERSKQELLAIPENTFQKCFDDWKKILA